MQQPNTASPEYAQFIPEINNHEEQKGKGRAVCLLMNFTATPNCISDIASRQTMGHQLLVYSAQHMLIPHTVFVVEINAGEKRVGWGCRAFASYQHCIQKSYSLLPLLTCQALLQLAGLSYMGVLFIFYYYSSYYHYCRHRYLAQGRELLRTCHPL